MTRRSTLNLSGALTLQRIGRRNTHKYEIHDLYAYQLVAVTNKMPCFGPVRLRVDLVLCACNVRKWRRETSKLICMGILHLHE